jgi:hypothetical protein
MSWQRIRLSRGARLGLLVVCAVKQQGPDSPPPCAPHPNFKPKEGYSYATWHLTAGSREGCVPDLTIIMSEMPSVTVTLHGKNWTKSLYDYEQSITMLLRQVS